MAYTMTGTYLESCNCAVLCPCGATSLALPADNDRCQVLLAFHVDEGSVDGVDVGGLSVAMVADTPGQMSDGGWRVGLIVDASASQEQAQALGSVFGGEQGGPPAMFGPLVGELMGMETAPIDYSDDGRVHAVRIGDGIDVEIEDFTNEAGETLKLVGPDHPAGPTLTIAQARKGRIEAFGLRIDNGGKNGHYAPFAWQM